MSTLDCDILHPSIEKEKHTCKKKTLIPNPRSEFVSLRCPSCMNVTTAFSHSHIPVYCEECNTTLAYPTGGRIKLAENVECRSKISA
ncbi:Rps27bp [Histomonas meleagridis]|uniref:Rps27bp n=1 Tax=Histomonas meleagridis TaxID=135588 RepID=UPI00355A1FC7|nr:Rps27bp [Histomonas meleagridis]KAH0786858.1 Rps27bp [Histomonas meleagridis]KAH0788523.1 Rps27bp [Histomonas meleagridis]KAH0791861.1 Rps27bp [Histomonas meleagridis]KAH0795442.1 Rps27bp [Histomonas meleagridis]